MANRRKFMPEFKKKVVLEALKERETLTELSQKHDLHPQQITTWKTHFLAHAEEIFEKEGGTNKEQDLDKERDELLRTICPAIPALTKNSPSAPPLQKIRNKNSSKKGGRGYRGVFALG